MDIHKAFIKQKIEELMKAHDTHHMKKKFKKDIEKLEVIKIQFCDIYKNVIALDNREEECKTNLKELNINFAPHKEEIHFIKIGVTAASNTDRVATSNNNNKPKRGMKESVPKDRNRMNISAIEPSDLIRPLTPQKKEVEKHIKLNDVKNEYSTTPNRNNVLNLTQLKVPDPIKKDPHLEIKEKNNKIEKKENITKSIKEEVGDKNKKEKEHEVKKETKSKDKETKKDKTIEKIIEKKDKKEKKEDHKMNEKIAKEEKEDKKYDKNKKDDHKEDGKLKENDREKIEIKHRRSIFQNKEFKQDQSKNKNRMSTSVIPDIRIDKSSELIVDSTNKEKRLSTSIVPDISMNEKTSIKKGDIIGNKLKEETKNELNIAKKESDKKELMNEKKDSKEEKKISLKERANESKRQSLIKIMGEKKNEANITTNNTDLRRPSVIKLNNQNQNDKKNEENNENKINIAEFQQSVNKSQDDFQKRDTPDHKSDPIINTNKESIIEASTIKETTAKEISNHYKDKDKEIQISKKDVQEINICGQNNEENKEEINDISINTNSLSVKNEIDIKKDNIIKLEENKVTDLQNEVIQTTNETNNIIKEEENVTNNLQADLKKTKHTKLKLNHFAELDFSYNYNRALLLTAIKNYLPFNKRMEILLNIKNLSLIKAEIVKILLSEYEEKVKYQQGLISKFEKDFLVENQVNRVFTPSKTASNGLNFITKDEENNLIKKEQQNEILNIFRCVYIIINENLEGIPPNKLIENLFINIFHRRKIENLKYLFLNVFPASLSIFTQSQYEKLIKLQQDYPKLLSSPDLLKLSRSVSYMTFILKEVFDYLNIKTVDGTHVYLIRTAKKTNPLIKEKIDKLQIVMNNL